MCGLAAAGSFEQHFPHLDDSLNAGEEQARAKRMIKATNVTYRDKAHLSALIAPIVPEPSLLALAVRPENRVGLFLQTLKLGHGTKRSEERFCLEPLPEGGFVVRQFVGSSK